MLNSQDIDILMFFCAWELDVDKIFDLDSQEI